MSSEKMAIEISVWIPEKFFYPGFIRIGWPFSGKVFKGFSLSDSSSKK
jgi:hypothetical protein